MYYRIRQVDFNGAFGYSPVIVVKNLTDRNGQAPQLLVNTSGQELIIHGGHPENTIQHVEVLDIRGVIIGEGRSGRFSYSSWPVGLYVVRIAYTNETGMEQQQVNKFVRR